MNLALKFKIRWLGPTMTLTPNRRHTYCIFGCRFKSKIPSSRIWSSQGSMAKEASSTEWAMPALLWFGNIKPEKLFWKIKINQINILDKFIYYNVYNVHTRWEIQEWQD